MANEQVAQRDPRVRLGLVNGVLRTSDGVTVVSAIGALVQMFDPMGIADAKRIGWELYLSDWETVARRACDILDISRDELRKLTMFLYAEGTPHDGVIHQLQKLK